MHSRNLTRPCIPLCLHLYHPTLFFPVPILVRAPAAGIKHQNPKRLRKASLQLSAVVHHEEKPGEGTQSRNLDRDTWAQSPALTQKPAPTDNSVQRKNSPAESHQVCKPRVRASPCPEVDSQYKTDSVLVLEGFCLTMLYLGAFVFNFTGLFLIYHGSWFCVCRTSLRMSISLC